MQHLGEPVDGGIRIRAPQRLVQRAQRVVVLLARLVVVCARPLGQLQDLLGLDQSGPVMVAGGVVSVDGVAVGTVASDGAGGAPLIIDLNASATAARVEVLVENLTYRNLSDDPREEALFQIQVEDGDGAASDPVTVRVEISASVDGPDGAFGERQVNNYTTNAQDDPAIARLADGGWVITWTSHDQDGSQDGVYARAYGPDGAPRGAEFRVNDATAGYQDMPEVAGLSDGGFVIVWREGLGTAIRMARYDATGTRTVADFQVENVEAFCVQRLVENIEAFEHISA